MSEDQFDDPGSADQFSPEAHEGRLLLVKPLQQLQGVTTVHGPKDAIESDVHILDGPEAGTVLRGSYIFPLVLQGQIKANTGTGRFNLGRLGKGTPKPGQKPPWKLQESTDDDKALARRYLASAKYQENNTTGPVAVAAAPPPSVTASDPWSGDEPPF
ncbi:hypothetical protein B5566_02645 [Mycobacterium sp. MHSD3]|nr:hypothetical protein B5566_02645 [Mycobacterium sp. MHSD3]